MNSTPRPHSSARASLRRGMTLIELVMSLIITSVILLACTSVLTIATRSMNSGARTAAVQAVTGRTAADQMADDLKLALSFTEQTATAVTFTVPDRNGDGQPETIRYAWTGAGAPLTRQYNGGTAVTIASNVQSLGFSFINKTLGTKPPTESAEQLLIAHNGGSGANIKTYNETTTAWQGQYFFVGPPPGTVSFKLTRVTLQLARKSTSTGTLGLQVRAADAAQKPTGAALVSATVDVSTLPTTATWVDVTFGTPLSGLDPAKGYCLVLTGSSSSWIEYTSWDNASTDSFTSYCTSSNSGSSWSTPTTTSALQFYVYGTITTP